MNTPLFLGMDVGSASVRAGIFDAHGQRLAFAERPIRQFHPHTDVVEQSSADIWAQGALAIRAALATGQIDPKRIHALGIDATCSLVAVGHQGSAVSVAEDGTTERDIIMWMDHRAGAQSARINASKDPALAYVGGEVSLEMELPKVLWFKEHYPDRYARVWRFFDLADYLVWRACGADVASVCTLTCKWNYLAHEQQFSKTLLAEVGLLDVLEKLPRRILPLGSAAGQLHPIAAESLGLPAGITVATGIIDAHAGGLALVGSAPEGRLAIICGTSNCHMIANQTPTMVPGIWGPYHGAMVPGYWLNEGGQSAAGALLDWTLRQSDIWPELAAAAEARGRNVYGVINEWTAELEQREPWPTHALHVLPDHHGNRSPRADPLARGTIVGLSLETGRDALARRYLATLQGLAYGTRHIIETLRGHGHRIEHIVMCGGSTKNHYWLREHADATGCPIELVSEDDAVTLGAALLGAVACGHFSTLPNAASAMVRPGRRIDPRKDTRAFHDAKYAVFLQLYDEMKHHTSAMKTWSHTEPHVKEAAC